MNDVYDPLEYYQSSLKAAHTKNTSEFFEDLVAKAGIDEALNAATIAALIRLEQLMAEAGKSSKLWKALRICLILAASALLYLAYTMHPGWAGGSTAAVAIVIFKLNPHIKSIDEHQTQLKTARDEKEAEAWRQMAPLNRLYGWGDFAALAHKTLPRIELDPYFTNERLDSLRRTYGWSDDFNDDRSVSFAHSGVINGNPFILAQTVNHWIGAKSYHGSLSISWTERVKGSDGKWKTVRRSQTLHASVTKPFPEYADDAVLIYGNQAAPDLSFSRKPSTLSGLSDGMVNNWRKSRAIKKLETKSRKLDGNSAFTVMANREFDALFGATDRDNEVQFRLLFTPLAQQEMVKLLKDTQIGYGDSFSFYKSRKINAVEPSCLSGMDISADPKLFHSHDLTRVRRYFNNYYNELFKRVYFGFAPLLAIPIYQQHRSHEELYKDAIPGTSCFWEHEAIANYMGEAGFEHPESVTRNILKTAATQADDEVQVVRITAHGYRGVNRVEYISVHGSDGHNHRVPVDWVEYLPVQKTSKILLHEGRYQDGDDHSSKWKSAFRSRGVPANMAIVRRSIAVAKLNK